MNQSATTSAAAAGPDPSESNLRDEDVLSGRGKVDHEGNKFFRNLVNSHVDQYYRHQSVGDRAGTLSVVRQIIDGVKANGGRFMTVNFRNMWVEMSYKETKDKTDRACRDAVRKNKAKYAAAALSVSEQQKQESAPELSLEEVFASTAEAAHSSPLLGLLAANVTTSASIHHNTCPLPTVFPQNPQQQQQTYRNPNLDYSCGSLYDTTTTSSGERRGSSFMALNDSIGMGNMNMMELSNGSLDIFRSDDDEKKVDEDEASIDYLAHTRTSTQSDQSSAQNAATAAADSCMSLDLCSIETAQPEGVQASSCTASLRENSDMTLRTGTKRGNKTSDEGMLVESFNKSMDFRE